MAQNPYEMGNQALKAAADLLDGQKLGGKLVDTGVSVVTAKNVQGFAD